MTEFTSWAESFVVLGIFSLIIILPCAFVAMMGVKLIEQIGNYPSKTPVIQMGILYKLVFLEIVTALAFFIFYNVFGQ